MIQLKNISKTYRTGPNKFQALHGIDLTIEKGEFVSICGPSGSGKTTLLNMIGCLDTFEAGQYLLNDTDVSRMRDKKRANLRNACIGFVLQDFALINAQTVLYNVMLPLLFSKCPYREIKKKALTALNSVHILDQAHKKVNQRAAPAGRHRQGDCQSPGNNSGRRADRSAGLRDQQADHGAFDGAEPKGHHGCGGDP